MDLGLAGKRVLVTGGSKGTGRAIAQAFSEEGCDVVITSRTQEELDLAAKEIGGSTGNRVLAVAGDWRQTVDVDRVVAETVEAVGGIDIFVPNAGDAPPGQFETLDDDAWMRGLSLKFLGHIRGCRAVLPHMVEQGSGAITMVVGNDGLKPPYSEVVPGACNAADLNVASSLAEQYGPKGIRVNTVNPGPIATTRWDWCEETISKERNLTMEQVRKLTLASLPLGYICTPEEVANVVLFLSSPKASYVNGANVPVDGAQRKPLMYVDLHFDINW